MKNQIQTQLSDEVMGALRTAAAKEGITASILARMILHKHFSKPETDAESKSYTFETKNWREIEAYAETKGLVSVEVFACFAIERYMCQNGPTRGQKQQIDKAIGDIG